MFRFYWFNMLKFLTGICTSRGNTLGYRYASPNGDEGRNNQHLGTHLVSAVSTPRCGNDVHIVFTAMPPQCDVATTTLHSPFSILHSSHTFSAKEHDAETGLSYFGARYYSSDLSIWLSVDPMSAKYPSLSPYVYCADNPIKLVDPNGEETLETDYRNYKGELLYRTNDGLNETILISDDIIPKLKQKLQKGRDEGIIDDPEYNKREMHSLGKTSEQYKASKDGSESNTIGDTWQMYYRSGYEEAYEKGKKSFFKLVTYSIMGFFDVITDSGGGAQEQYEGWAAGQVEGEMDKNNGYINAMNPESSFKENKPLIRLK